MLAFTRKARKTGLITLIKPLSHENVLVKDEVIFYCERQHWTYLVKPAFTMIASLFVVTALASGSATLNGTTSLLTVVAIAWLVYSELRTRVFSKKTAYFIIAAFGISSFVLGPHVVAAALISYICVKFATQFALWAFYHRRYITNRRLIASEGFLGSSISTMPLSRVTDISVEKTFFAEIFDYSTLRVESAGQDQALGTIRHLIRPDEFYEILINLSTSEVEFEKFFEA